MRSGNKIIFVKKDDTPIPPTLQVGDKTANIRYWGQILEDEEITSKKNDENVLSQSLFSQDNIDGAEGGQLNPFNKPQAKKKPQGFKAPSAFNQVSSPRRGRSQSRQGSPTPTPTNSRKRSLSNNNRCESPSKNLNLSTSSSSDTIVPPKPTINPSEAGGQNNRQST